MKLTPPAMQNLRKREMYFKKHNDLPDADYEISRIEKIKKRKEIPDDYVYKKKKKEKKDRLNIFKNRIFGN